MKWLLLVPLAVASSSVAEDKPEALLMAAKKAADTKTLKVSAQVMGGKSVRIGGIISGRDFDLTIKGADTTLRQIVKGDKAWVTDDDGRTWKPVKLVDRRYYFLVHAPINFQEGERIPAFEKLETAEENGESLTHVRLINKEPVAYEGDRPNAWLVMKEGAPAGVRRYEGPLVFENDYVPTRVNYAAAKDGAGVAEPPGNPDAVPPENPADLLLQAAQEHMGTGVWEVHATISGPNTLKMHGLLHGNDFDLAFEGKNGAGMRQIKIQDKAWYSKDGGKTWTSGGGDDLLMYNLVHVPLMFERVHPEFEEAGVEDHKGEKWQHLRLKVLEKLESESQRVHYWLSLGTDGKPTGIRHYEGKALVQGETPFCKIDYAPAKDQMISKPIAKK